MSTRIPTLTVAAMALAMAAPVTAIFPEPIKVEGGLISGVPAFGWGVREFRGIPFAAPPIGNLRWRAPQPVVPWEGVRSMQTFGPPCMQQEQPLNGLSWNRHVLPFSEDCLYLNVWTPATSPAERLPVLIWIYGGGGVLGYAGDPRYDGSMLAKKGVVVVSMSYRVNVFGWLAHPELTKESPNHASGNYGSLDQLAAVTWVRHNIAAFGGDPDKLTVWGQSGGSRSVNFLIASPLARGLARAAIAHSHTSFGRMATLQEAEQNGLAFMKAAGKSSLAELRAMSSEEVFKVFQANAGGLSGAIVDGWFLPTDIYTIYAQGKQNDVALMTGATNDEGGSLSVSDEGAAGRGGGRGRGGEGGGGGGRGGGAPDTVAAYTAWAQRTLGSRAAEFLTLYPATTDAEARQAYHDATRDFNFAGHRTWARMQSATGKQPVFMYLFSHRPPFKEGNGNSPTPLATAAHNSDMVFTFNNLRLWDYDWTDTDRKVADSMGTYWTNFVKTLNPNGAGLPAWTAYNPKNEMMLNIGDTLRMEKISTPRMDFITGIQEGARVRR
jgi:para-nitrobenzyl esterase